MTDPAAPPPPPSDAHVAAIAAYCAVRPEAGAEEAAQQVARAICSAAAHHGAWFWRGAG